MKPSQIVDESRRLLRLVREDRPEIYRRFRRYAGVARAQVLFRDCEIGSLVNAQGLVRVIAEGAIRLGDRVQLVRGAIPTLLHAHRGAEIVVGANTIFNHSARVEARCSVHIGERCMIASLVTIDDTDADGTAPIVIGDDVWIAHGVTVMPGVTIGAGSVVSAGSVVRSDVPPRSLAAGVPATCAPLASVDAQVRPPRAA